MDPYLFEVSSEAGRKIGGIYTVIRSKSRFAHLNFKGRYIFIGFYDERCSQDVKFQKPDSDMQEVFDELAASGIFCHYGTWIYADNTPIILVDSRNFSQKPIQYEVDGQIRQDIYVNYIKYMLWKHYSIDSLMERSWDFSENACWGWAVGMLLEKLSRLKRFNKHPMLAQFHEWISGSALLYCRMQSVQMATIFTTHATVLGRTLTSHGKDILRLSQQAVSQIDISEAYMAQVEGKHQLEMQAAKKAHVFTTVSESVAQEVRYILGRYPDVITVNGMDFEYEQSENQVRNLSRYVRQEILQLCQSIFAPYHQDRFDNALLLFTSGRFEYKNKGFDLYIRALGQLNKELKKSKDKKQKQVIAFIFAPNAIRGPKLSIIKNYLLIDKINEVLDETLGHDSKEQYYSTRQRIKAVRGNLKRDLESMYSSLIKEGDRPPLNIFDLNHDHDIIVETCLAQGLDNSEGNPVKVVYYPSYLSPRDGLLNMSYYDVISGMDMGVFPSRYEPFGYTPLEAGIKCNIAVSTDCAGFGKFLDSKLNLAGRGVKILKLTGGEEQAVTELSDFVKEVYNKSGAQIQELKLDSYEIMHNLDWRDLISNYIRAYDLALERAQDIVHETPDIDKAPMPLLQATASKAALLLKESPPLPKRLTGAAEKKISTKNKGPREKKGKRKKG